MMSTKYLGMVIALMFAGSARAGQIPIEVTGFTHDMVVEVGGSFSGSITATMDFGTTLVGATFYETGQNPDAPWTGLPMGTTFVSQDDPDTSFFLQAADTNNALLLDIEHAFGILTLTTPGRYESLSFIGSTGNGTNVPFYVLNFADGTFEVGKVVFADWYYNDPVAYAANGRINDTEYENVYGYYPAIYQVDLGSIPSTSDLVSIEFVYGFGDGHVGIFGVSGTVAAPAVPEPSSVAMLGLGAACLVAGNLFRRRDKKA